MQFNGSEIKIPEDLIRQLSSDNFIETFDAWNRMREQFGRAPYPLEKFLDRDEYDYTHGIRKRPPKS